MAMRLTVRVPDEIGEQLENTRKRVRSQNPSWLEWQFKLEWVESSELSSLKSQYHLKCGQRSRKKLRN